MYLLKEQIEIKTVQRSNLYRVKSRLFRTGPFSKSLRDKQLHSGGGVFPQQISEFVKKFPILFKLSTHRWRKLSTKVLKNNGFFCKRGWCSTTLCIALQHDIYCWMQRALPRGTVLNHLVFQQKDTSKNKNDYVHTLHKLVEWLKKCTLLQRNRGLQIKSK